MVGVVVILGAVISTAVFGIDADQWVSMAESIMDMDTSVDSTSS